MNGRPPTRPAITARDANPGRSPKLRDGERRVTFARAPANRGPELRIIRSGLEPTDKIIINGLMRVRPGMKVAAEEGKIDIKDPEE